MVRPRITTETRPVIQTRTRLVDFLMNSGIKKAASMPTAGSTSPERNCKMGCSVVGMFAIRVRPTMVTTRMVMKARAGPRLLKWR